VPPQQEQRVDRRLAAIFAADIAGYSRLVSQDEAGTLRALSAAREIMDRLIQEHGGRIANTAGDSVLAEFPSAVDAVQCAVAVQEKLAEGRTGEPEDRRLQFRIGVHVGDVVVRGEDLLGDGVNIAARLEALAEPGGIAISGAAQGYVRKALPLAYADLGEQVVKGFDEPVRAYAVKRAAPIPPPSTSQPKPPLPLPDKPSIAVLPFTNMSGDPEQEYFADGVVEDIITALSHFNGLFVIARNSTFVYKGRAVDVKQVGKDLGVRYVLEGSVRRGGNRLRVSGQLADAATGRHVWSDKIEGSVEEVFDFQDQITECVVGAIQPSLLEAEAERLRPRPTDSLSAYELYLRALPLLDRVSREGCSDAKVLLTKATEADPQFGVAYATAAQCHVQRLFQGWSDDPPREESEGMILVNAALEKGNDDAEVLWRAGFALSAFGGDLDRCLAMLKRALELSPNSAHAWQWLGWVQVYAGQYERAAGSFERARRLSPRDIRAFVTTIGLSACRFFLGNFEEAVRLAREAVAQNPRFTSSWRFLAAALAQSGRQAEAEDAVRSLLSLDPRLTTRSISGGIRKTPNLHFYFNGLRNAGLPE